MYAGAFAAAFYLPQLVLTSQQLAHYPGSVEQAVAASSILASLLVFGLTRGLRFDPLRILDYGLCYEVLASFGIAMAELWRVQPQPMSFEIKQWFGISWVCVWIVVFPVVVPSTPGKTLLASMASAAMVPLALLMSTALAPTPPVPGLFWIGMMISVLVAVGIAYFSSRVIYQLGAGVREARELGSYQLVERIGVGGMGEVWMARHRMLARPAAIKLILADDLAAGRSGDLRRRFEREAQTTAKLQSPHTVELYDFGITESGEFYYAMELLEGVDFGTLVRRFGPQPAGRVASFLRQACDSLAEAHERGVIHRDIKPGNLFACRLGRQFDFVKVLDFGLVKTFRGAGSEDTQLTVQGIAAGTPAFMAPEMLGGDGEVGPPADLYALGCVGYWLLTGALVFEAETPIKLALQHVQEQPVAPSRRTETEVPESLERIVLQCLEKHPARRPAGAEALADALVATGLETSWTRVDASSWWELHRAEVVERCSTPAPPSPAEVDGAHRPGPPSGRLTP